MNGVLLSEDIIGKLYGSSPLPAAAVDSSGAVIYANSAYTSLFGGDAPGTWLIRTGESYKTRINIKEQPFDVYVTALNKDESIINVSPAADGNDGRVDVLSAAARHAASIICSAADNLSYLISTEEANGYLNFIETGVLTLLSEFLVPDAVIRLKNAVPENLEICSVSAAVGQYAAELSTIFSENALQVTTNISAGLFAKTDMNALKLILTDFTVRTMEYGEYRTETVAIKLSRWDSGVMRLTVSCGSIMRLRKEAGFSAALQKRDDYTPYKELIRLAEEKLGCSFGDNSGSSHTGIYIDIPICEPPESGVFHSSQAYYGAVSRFSDENLYFARFRMNPRYRDDNK